MALAGPHPRKLVGLCVVERTSWNAELIRMIFGHILSKQNGPVRISAGVLRADALFQLGYSICPAARFLSFAPQLD